MTITQDGYLAKISRDAGTGVYTAEILNARGVPGFEAGSFRALQQAFKDMLAQYAKECAARGEKMAVTY